VYLCVCRRKRERERECEESMKSTEPFKVNSYKRNFRDFSWSIFKSRTKREILESDILFQTTRSQRFLMDKSSCSKQKCLIREFQGQKLVSRTGMSDSKISVYGEGSRHLNRGTIQKNALCFCALCTITGELTFEKF